MVHPEFDGAAQDPDRLIAVAGRGVGRERLSGLGQPHRAESDPVDPQVAEGPGPRGRGWRARAWTGDGSPS
ncbi:hypothetical protein Airi01_027120 [Actinoallomurus iriomotensis]|uniref:Uncharacterized protein n=1 Tax=Actinoallomurus iriomotensis TaxID=478107 RepID=A0A9W6RGX5_9ACTN|nr:hypothetical protein Airi01_027120 [Actinoallomurus iriomotensis]